MSQNIIAVMRRYEIKYLLSALQAEHFRPRILKYMEEDHYGLTAIQSLYYDTSDYALVRKSIEKPPFKEKIRLRSYGLAQGDSSVFLEIKRKKDKVVYKRRIVTSESKANCFLEGKTTLGKEQIARELKAFKDRYGVLIPQYLIASGRIAYCKEGSDLRITLDQNIRYRSSDLNLHSSLEGIPLLRKGEVILEIKVQDAIPLWFVDILSSEKIYPVSYSKVGAAYQKEMTKTKDRILVALKNKKGGTTYGLVI